MLTFQQDGQTVAAVILRVTVVGIFVLLLPFAVDYYRSDYLLTQAEQGLKTFSDYGSIIAEASRSNDAATLRYSDYLNSRGDPRQATDVLKNGYTGINSWQGWERQGILLEKQGFTVDGAVADVNRASQLYDRVLRVFPTYQNGLQRSALIALKVGDWKKAYALADQLDFNYYGNPESDYIRARAAEGEGDTEKQFALLQQVSASSNYFSSTLFSTESIHDKLRILMSNSNR